MLETGLLGQAKDTPSTKAKHWLPSARLRDKNRQNWTQHNAICGSVWTRNYPSGLPLIFWLDPITAQYVRREWKVLSRHYQRVKEQQSETVFSIIHWAHQSWKIHQFINVLAASRAYEARFWHGLTSLHSIVKFYPLHKLWGPTVHFCMKFIRSCYTSLFTL